MTHSRVIVMHLIVIRTHLWPVGQSRVATPGKNDAYSPENDLFGDDNLKINILTREYADAITVK